MLSATLAATRLRNRFKAVLEPRGAEDAFHDGQVALVAGILEHPVWALMQADQSRPGACPGGGIGEGDLVVDPVGRGAGKALDDVEVFAGSEEVALRREIRGLDDQRLSLPAP